VSLPRDDFQFALEDRQRLVSQVSLEPAVADRRLYGYRITWLREGGDFHRLGLRDGDVIVSLNGVQAGDPGTFMQAVNGLRGTTSFALGVERDGAQIEYSYLLD
jgi:type II secretion system protein C